MQRILFRELLIKTEEIRECCFCHSPCFLCRGQISFRCWTSLRCFPATVTGLLLVCCILIILILSLLILKPVPGDAESREMAFSLAFVCGFKTGVPGRQQSQDNKLFPQCPLCPVPSSFCGGLHYPVDHRGEEERCQQTSLKDSIPYTNQKLSSVHDPTKTFPDMSPMSWRWSC